jgi:hypothetical protein
MPNAMNGVASQYTNFDGTPLIQIREIIFPCLTSRSLQAMEMETIVNTRALAQIKYQCFG